MADEAYHGVVSADDEDEKHQCRNHQSFLRIDTAEKHI